MVMLSGTQPPENTFSEVIDEELERIDGANSAATGRKAAATPKIGATRRP
jgi:hypothetical protein